MRYKPQYPRLDGERLQHLLQEEIDAMIAAGVAAERERCAKIVDSFADGLDPVERAWFRDCAAAIRKGEE